MVGRDTWETGYGPGKGWPGTGEEETNSVSDLEVKEGRVSKGLQAGGRIKEKESQGGGTHRFQAHRRRPPFFRPGTGEPCQASQGGGTAG